MEDNSIDLTVTSPPYGDLRVYDEGQESVIQKITGKNKGAYLEFFDQLAKELYRVTKEGGVVVWVVGDKTEKGSESGISFEQALHFKAIGFRLHDTMIYQKANPMPQNHNRYEQAFEYMFILSKGRPNVFNPIMEPSKTAGQAYDFSKRGGAATLKEKNPIMRKKDSISVTKAEKVKGNIWSYLVGMNKSTKDKIAFQHPAIFPEALAEDHILSWSNPGDVVFDPFSGSGTTAKMAKKNGRQYIGFEISPVFCAISDARLKEVQENLLPELNALKES